MADIFMKSDAVSLLSDKFILLLGDSNMSLIYNDLLYLLHHNNIPSSKLLRGRSKRRWDSYLGDKVLQLSEFDIAGRDYFKEREYKKDNLHVRYHFVTKVSGSEMNITLADIEKQEMPYPDVVIVNSCMWDITRWGAMREDDYKNDLIKFFTQLKKILPEDTLVIWTSTLPISSNFTKGGVLIQQLEFIKFSLRFMILEANKFTQQLCMAFGIDFLDLHYHMRLQLHRRSVDGIHWEPQAVRHISCLILTHIALAFEVPLPGRVQNRYTETCIEKADDHVEVDIKSLQLEKNIKDNIIEEIKRIDEMKKPTKKRPAADEKTSINNHIDNKKPAAATERIVKKGRRRDVDSEKCWQSRSRPLDLREVLHGGASSSRDMKSSFDVDVFTSINKPLEFHFASTSSGVPPWETRNNRGVSSSALPWVNQNRLINSAATRTTRTQNNALSGFGLLPVPLSLLPWNNFLNNNNINNNNNNNSTRNIPLNDLRRKIFGSFVNFN